jgi:2'-5' RNA ligase
MIKRSITIFPEFHNIDVIQKLREKYDPLFELIPPHITLVFPFTSDMTTTQLREHMEKVLTEEKVFSIRLQGVTGAGGEYLFLNVKEGNDDLIRIHDRLYSGVLNKFFYREVSYIPHLTVGRLGDKQSFEHALKETEDFREDFITVINKVTAEIIDEKERSHPEIHYNLRN